MQLTVKDAAKLLQVSERTIYRWISEGSIPSFRVQEQHRFNRVELLEWATSRRIPVSPEIFDEPQDEQPIPSLSDALERGGIHYRVSGNSRETVLRSVASLLHLPEEVDREFLYSVFLARERLGSTGIGDGIAIPHVRSPVVLHVTRPEISLCFLEQPIDFDAIDGKPVSILFALVTPTVRAHLQLLSHLSFLLRDESIRDVLKRQGGREEIVAAFRHAESALRKPSPARSADDEHAHT
jgi:PTS system nitrogen regulatory IIA component